MSDYMNGTERAPLELEEATANSWLSTGAITIESTGSENTYYIDDFGRHYFCKNYPQ